MPHVESTFSSKCLFYGNFTATIEPCIRVLVDSGKVRWDLKARNGKTCRDIAMSPLIVNLMKEYASKQKKEL